MKKKILIAICLIISLFIFLKYAKDNRIWPFGSSIAYKIPNSLKSFVYNLTEDKNKEIDTFVHNLKLSYYQIPEHNFLTTESIQDVVFQETIGLFNNLNSLYILFYEPHKLASTGKTKKIYINTKKTKRNRQTKKKQLKA